MLRGSRKLELPPQRVETIPVVHQQNLQLSSLPATCQLRSWAKWNTSVFVKNY